MNIIRIARDALSTVWNHKHLWLFGFFVAGASGGGGGGQGGAPTAGGAGVVPDWVFWLLAGGVILGLAAGVMYIISEGALIEAVVRVRGGEAFSVGHGFRCGLSHFWRVLCIKALMLLALVLSVGVVAAPAVLGKIGVIPLWLGLSFTVPLALVAVPWVLTLYFIYSYALRFAVLDRLPVTAAIRQARVFLHGKLGSSLKLLVAGGLGSVAAGLVGVLIVVPAFLLGGAGYMAGGIIPAVTAGAALALPVAVALAGALGTYRSSVWTLGYLEGRA